jgi:galactoside O-acetyltransferase/dTDP-4-amino-4,6-dideoxygalactose transaminase
LLPGTHVADGCVIGGGAVAHGSLEEFGLYVGNPARRVRDRSPDAQQRLVGSMEPLQ